MTFISKRRHENYWYKSKFQFGFLTKKPFYEVKRFYFLADCCNVWFIIYWKLNFVILWKLKLLILFCCMQIRLVLRSNSTQISLFLWTPMGTVYIKVQHPPVETAVLALTFAAGASLTSSWGSATSGKYPPRKKISSILWWPSLCVSIIFRISSVVSHLMLSSSPICIFANWKNILSSEKSFSYGYRVVISTFRFHKVERITSSCLFKKIIYTIMILSSTWTPWSLDRPSFTALTLAPSNSQPSTNLKTKFHNLLCQTFWNKLD